MLIARLGVLGAAVSAALVLTGGLAAQELTPANTTWDVQADFGKRADGEKAWDQARTNLSGAACALTEPPFQLCLMANDAKKYAQLFKIEDTTIVRGALVRLVGQEADGDPDAEGAAFADGFFYVVGSHGRSRHHKKDHNPSSYVVFRFPVDEGTGRPTVPFSEDNVIEAQPSDRLRAAIKHADGIKDFYDRPLDKGGVNIEGIAVKAGRMHLGLRGPSVKKHAFILSVDAEAVFSEKQDLNSSVSRLKLGKHAGIRDLAAVRDGLLVLSGPVNDQDVAPALFHWSEKTQALKKLGDLKRPASVDGGAKAEVLLVLRDHADEPWRVLIMFDGPPNGAPTEYLVPR